MSVGADIPLSDRVVLLQGATGELGSALARRLRDAGARLGVAVRHRRQVGRIGDELGVDGVLAGCVPPRDAEAAAGFVKGVEDSLGPIDAFLSTAGAFHAGPAARETSTRLEELLEANLFAPATLARAVLLPMRRRRTGSLVFTGAAAVGRGGAGLTAYLTAKAALHEFSRALSLELAEDGLRVAVVTPEVLDTEANRKAMPEADPGTWQSLDSAVETLVCCAFGEPVGPGPLYPVTTSGYKKADGTTP